MDNQLQKQYFSTELLLWYERSKRDLPWRRSKNPYYIWVSEIMLQQTRVDTVIPYFHRFIEKFPTVAALAAAPESEVLKAWEGLGYYSRARNLQSAVREVHEQYNGIVPSDKAEISELKGVGPYTAGAILSIAYNQPEPAVDGNVMRVLSRYFALEDDIAKPSTRIGIERLAQGLIPAGEAGAFNQALMELGATVCTPRAPQCLTCPVQVHCAGRLAGIAEQLPVKTKAKPPRPERRAVALIVGSGAHGGQLLIRQRPQDGLLARMWELPHAELPPARSASAAEGVTPAAAPARGAQRRAARGGVPEESHDVVMAFLREHLAAADGIGIVPKAWFMNTEHVFSHILWDMFVYRCEAAAAALSSEAPNSLPPNYRWLNVNEMEEYPFPNVFLRIINEYKSLL
ncbi:A/G-specific adenine glycosylase [Paenibacillus psychroresistens]|uniref:Adenine DNA glycosylase n=1 Tax=Paenibacillus psychroresistens TaxID=1778678 RepID=A0A6B8RQF1_9BACL|nr:A/G-specific adenine glycosylase [Paenibacillus psychroresistens]QGQ98600.1 A/G-specific adenine glycosylase [Paenibacillus psychroresistens]